MYMYIGTDARCPGADPPRAAPNASSCQERSLETLLRTGVPFD